MRIGAMRIGVVAPGTRIDPAMAERVKAYAADTFLDRAPELVVHPQCFLSSGHFAGADDERAAAFLDTINDPLIDAVWIARGGYGACRITETVMAGCDQRARKKPVLGYSDAGAILGGLYRIGFERLAHGPMLVDIIREGGEAAVKRALSYLVDQNADSLELTVSPDVKTAAYNMMILSSILGSKIEPDLTDHVLMLEEVGEYMYRIDRTLFHITSSPMVRRVRGIKLGRCSPVPKNDPDFGKSEEEVVRYWCARADIPYLGRADIGHDIDNRVVPFGTLKRF
ncbi:LD-carboxypeptidase [Terricaulis sp.]|uniref:LD-carboxypeptidase n=1 Tax=Terricaulis sp. TaxID=2768686 RepID=UPI003784774B